MQMGGRWAVKGGLCRWEAGGLWKVGCAGWRQVGCAGKGCTAGGLCRMYHRGFCHIFPSHLAEFLVSGFKEPIPFTPPLFYSSELAGNGTDCKTQ